jgi:membrane protein DedA with SNARE-associated domain
MAELLQQLLQWVNDYPGWAGAVVFITAFVESLAIVGVIVPGVAILFTVGALIGADALNFWHMVIWAVAGAVLGDGLSYWIGKHYQTQLTRIWPFNKHPASLEKGIAFFQRYGGKSVAMGRFFGPIRAVIPLVAGMMNMPTGRFLVANVLSALAWAPAYLLPGMAFGASMELASEVALSLVILLVILVGSLWFLGWFSHRLFLLIQPHSQDILRTILSMGEKYPRLGGIAGALGDPEHPEAAGLSALAGLLISASLLLMLTALIPLGIMEILDSSIHLPLQNLTTPTGNHIMLAISVLADSSTSMFILFILWALLSIFHLPLAARHWLAGAGSIWLLTLAGQYLLLRQPSLIPSLPDLYVLRASMIFGLAAVLLSSSIVFSKRWRIYSTASILVMAVTLAQLYHGSTVAAILHALMLGLIWTAATGMAYRTHSHKERMTHRQALIIGVSIISLAGVSALSTSAPMYAPSMPDIRDSVSADSWWHSEWQRLPKSRDDFAHLKNHPMNLQYQGSVEALGAALEQTGWQAVDTDAGLDWLKLLSPSTDMAQLPALPHSHEGRYESYQFIKPVEDQRLTLYLWPSRYILQPEGEIIWLGEVGEQRIKHKMGLISYPVTQQDHQQALQQLADDLAESGLQIKRPAGKSVILLRSVEPPHFARRANGGTNRR